MKLKLNKKKLKNIDSSLVELKIHEYKNINGGDDNSYFRDTRLTVSVFGCKPDKKIK